MSFARLRLAARSACAALVALACATKDPNQPHPGMEKLWRDYLAMPQERALVIAGDPTRLWVGAASGGHASASEAEEGALLECRRRRAARRMQAPCLLYARGDEIVWKEW